MVSEEGREESTKEGFSKEGKELSSACPAGTGAAPATRDICPWAGTGSDPCTHGCCWPPDWNSENIAEESRGGKCVRIYQIYPLFGMEEENFLSIFWDFLRFSDGPRPAANTWAHISWVSLVTPEQRKQQTVQTRLKNSNSTKKIFK